MTHQDHINHVDMDQFYSSAPIDVWRQVLGDALHYHHGIWTRDEGWAEALHNAVVSLARHVPRHSTVLDLGCGWGGPATVLREELGCSVLGVTVSRAQAVTCRDRGLETLQADLDREIPDGTWSVGWWMESLEHLEQPEKALAALRSRCERLVLRVNTCEVESGRLFGGSMPMLSTRSYLEALAWAGWTVVRVENRRAESLPSAARWLEGLKQAGMACPLDPHLRALWDYALFFSSAPAMYAYFPLMDIVAE